MFGEPAFGHLQVAQLEQRNLDEEPRGSVPAEQPADPVQQAGADHRAGRRGEQRASEREGALAGREAGHRQHDLAGDRRKEVVHADRDRGTDQTELVHQVDHDPGKTVDILPAGHLVGRGQGTCRYHPASITARPEHSMNTRAELMPSLLEAMFPVAWRSARVSVGDDPDLSATHVVDDSVGKGRDSARAQLWLIVPFRHLRP